jgi:hypothetical protein
VEFIVDKRQQFFGGLSIAGFDLAKDLRDVAHWCHQSDGWG